MKPPGGRAKQAGRRATGEAEIVFPDGDDIVREDDVGHDMFIVQSGQVRISKRKAHGEVVLATLDKGDFFGEMSLLESLPREATARAVGETRLLVLSRGGLLLRLRRDPTFALEMLNHLSSRLRGRPGQAHRPRTRRAGARGVNIEATEEHLVVVSDLHPGQSRLHRPDPAPSLPRPHPEHRRQRLHQR